MNGTNDPFTPPTTCWPRSRPGDCVDFHARLPARKLRWLALDGRVTAVLGTHTHIPLPMSGAAGGTAYLTDVGMSGPYDSIIGVEKELVLHRFLTACRASLRRPRKTEDVRGAGELQRGNGRASRIQRIMLGNSHAPQSLCPDFMSRAHPRAMFHCG